MCDRQNSSNNKHFTCEQLKSFVFHELHDLQKVFLFQSADCHKQVELP